MKCKKLGFWIVFTLYLLLLAADIITTFMVGEAKSVLETNPLLKLGFGFTPILLLNGAITWLIWWAYSRPNSTPTARFILIIAMMMIICVRIYAIQNAWVFIENPITVEEAKEIATPEAFKETQQQVVMLAYPPFIFVAIAFLFWRLDHKVEKK